MTSLDEIRINAKEARALVRWHAGRLAETVPARTNKETMDRLAETMARLKVLADALAQEHEGQSR